jgi:protein SCO1/2
MKTAVRTTLTLLASLTLLLLSCSKQEQKPTDLATFPLKGEVVAIDTVKHRLTISHEEIPNYMDAMTMPFKVKDLELLKSVDIGDSIQGVLAVSHTESWLETFTITGKSEASSTHLAEGATHTRVFKEGESLPAVELTNQDAKQIYFNNFKGKALALTFIYTRCPLPDFCIRMSNHFAKIQRLLSKDKALDGKWHLISISFDPKFDTPKVLKNYGQSYRADLTTWDFVTGDQTAITKLTIGLGLSLSDDEGGLIAHNLRTVLLNKEGKIVRVIQGNEWTPEEVVDAMKKMVHE